MKTARPLLLAALHCLWSQKASLSHVLSLEIISEPFAKSSRKNYERTRTTLPNFEKMTPPILRAGFSRFGRGGMRSLIVLS